MWLFTLRSSSQRVHLLTCLLAITASLAIAAVTMAEPAAVKKGLSETRDTLWQTEQALKWIPDTPASLDKLDALLKGLLPTRIKAQQCVDQIIQRQENLTKDLASLGGVTPSESSDVTKKRQGLSQQKTELEKQLASCRLLLLQNQELNTAITKQQQDIRARELFARGPNLWTVVQNNLAQPTSWWKASLNFMRARSGLERVHIKQALELITLLGLSLLAGAVLDRTFRAPLLTEIESVDFCTAFMCALRSCTAKILPRLFPVIATGAYFTLFLPGDFPAFITEVVYGLGLYLVAMTAINILLTPCPPATFYLPVPVEHARRLAHRLRVLIGFGVCGFLLFASSLPDVLPIHVSHLLHAIFLVSIVVNLIWIIWLGRQLSGAILSGGLLLLLILILLGTLTIEFMGYRNFSSFLLQGLIGTLFGLGLTIFVGWVFGDFLDGFDTGRFHWQQRTRELLGLQSGQNVPGLIWLRIIVFLVLWTSFALLVLWLWGLSHTGWALIRTYLTQGVQIGSLKIWPSRLLVGILILALFLNITRLIQKQIGPHWLQHTRLDRGSREALTKMVGYIGVVMTVMISLSVVGVQFQNFAIIAGALSVGIGFGLQNIVNNFVSGLILLFERPIRTGDWITVGQTEGYVKSINIRSTQVETFDRAAVLVPNSEFISSQVTNWVLRDPWGRVKVPVGVAYGSDTAKVKQILIDMANSHNLVIKNHSLVSSPYVLFLEFGDSTLQFELRCYVYNVDERLTVLSDLNFAIDAAFREAGIEIAFPQRDVHIRDWPNAATKPAFDHKLSTTDTRTPEVGPS